MLGGCEHTHGSLDQTRGSTSKIQGPHARGEHADDEAPGQDGEEPYARPDASIDSGSHDPIAHPAHDDAGAPPVSIEPSDEDAGTDEPRCTEPIHVTSQAELDSVFRGCTHVARSVYIDADAVDNLAAMSEIETITGDLVIRPAEGRIVDPDALRLRSLAALAKLRHVGGLLHLQGLPLEDLRGLEQLQWQNLTLEDMPSLRELTGLGEGGFGTVRLAFLPKLINLSGLRAGDLSQVTLESLTSLQDLSGASITRAQPLYIRNAPALRTLAGWPAVTWTLDVADAPLLKDLAMTHADRIGALFLTRVPSLTSLADLKAGATSGGVVIKDCDGLVSLAGLEGMTWLDSLIIEDSDNLRSLRGLDALTRVEYGLVLSRLPALTTLEGLERLETATVLSLNELSGLVDLGALESARGFGSLYVIGASGLTSLAGLETLTGTTVLKVERSPIVSLAGLGNLRRLTILELIDNPALQSLRALSGVSSVQDATIGGNTALPQCEVDWLAERWGFELLDLGTNGPVGTCAP